MNDITIMQLQKQAVMQARAGSDVVAPSGIQTYVNNHYISSSSSF
jgi:delta-aminolevulinic acid dehydratase/porphobilinogen synthase